MTSGEAVRARVQALIDRYEDVLPDLVLRRDQVRADVVTLRLAVSELEAVERQRAADTRRLRDQQDETERLRAELATREALIKDHLAKILHLENRVDAEAHRAETAEADLAARDKALERYGHHEPGCMYLRVPVSAGGRCTCGLDAARSRAEGKPADSQPEQEVERG